MSKILFFDTETTGKADFKSAPDAKHQPRIVQLAALLCDIRTHEMASLNLIVTTKDPIPEEASRVHGITTQISKDFGVPLFYAIQAFWALARQADVHVAHNIEFDWLLIIGESLRTSTDSHPRPQVCTMKQMTPLCNLPGPYGPKWPKLQEAYTHAFGREFDGAHDALADVRACKEIYFWLEGKVAVIPSAVVKPTVGELLARQMRDAI